eukprot:364208-Chlamydomonas_euryale.AAC.18
MLCARAIPSAPARPSCILHGRSGAARTVRRLTCRTVHRMASKDAAPINERCSMCMHICPTRIHSCTCTSMHTSACWRACSPSRWHAHPANSRSHAYGCCICTGTRVPTVAAFARAFACQQLLHLHVRSHAGSDWTRISQHLEAYDAERESLVKQSRGAPHVAAACALRLCVIVPSVVRGIHACSNGWGLVAAAARGRVCIHCALCLSQACLGLCVYPNAEVQKRCKQAIYLLHQGSFEEAGEQLRDAERLAGGVLPTLKQYPTMRQGTFSFAMEEVSGAWEPLFPSAMEEVSGAWEPLFPSAMEEVRGAWTSLSFPLPWRTRGARGRAIASVPPCWACATPPLLAVHAHAAA